MPERPSTKEEIAPYGCYAVILFIALIPFSVFTLIVFPLNILNRCNHSPFCWNFGEERSREKTPAHTEPVGFNLVRVVNATFITRTLCDAHKDDFLLSDDDWHTPSWKFKVIAVGEIVFGVLVASLVWLGFKLGRITRHTTVSRELDGDMLTKVKPPGETTSPNHSNHVDKTYLWDEWYSTIVKYARYLGAGDSQFEVIAEREIVTVGRKLLECHGLPGMYLMAEELINSKQGVWTVCDIAWKRYIPEWKTAQDSKA